MEGTRGASESARAHLPVVHQRRGAVCRHAQHVLDAEPLVVVVVVRVRVVGLRRLRRRRLVAFGRELLPVVQPGGHQRLRPRHLRSGQAAEQAGVNGAPNLCGGRSLPPR